MIRVIERHDYHLDDRVTCNNCGSIISYSCSDVNEGRWSKTIECPICGSTITISSIKGNE